MVGFLRRYYKQGFPYQTADLKAGALGKTQSDEVRREASLVKIADAEGFDFQEYLNQLKEREGLKLKSTNGIDKAEFALEGKGWPFFFIWELDSFKTKADGYIEVEKRGDNVDLYCGCRLSEKYKRNRNIFVVGFIIFILFNIFLAAFIVSGTGAICYLTVMLVALAVAVPFQYYVLGKYENIGMNNQLYSFKRRLTRGTLADGWDF
jgi:hypothetical protein